MSIELITKRFDEVFDLSLGRTPSRGDKSYWGGNHTWVSIADMSCGKYISSSKECITDKALVDTGIPLVRKGTVIMSFKLSIGKVCIANKDLYTNEAIMAFSLNGKYNILPDYLYYYLRAYKWKVSNEVVLGFTLNKKNISNSLITFPASVSEQQRIVDSLDSSFSKIEALRANAEKRLQSIGALYQSVLKSSLSPQHGWVHETMGDRCKLSQGLAINSHTKHLLVKESSLPLLRIKDMKEGTRELFVNEKECPNSCRAYPDDLIYTRTGNTLGLIFTGMYGVLHNNCFKIEIDRERLDKAFYIYYVQQDEFRNRILSLAKRAAQPDITHKIFKEQPLIYPSLEIQRAIVGKIERVDSICKELQESCLRTIELCDDLKKALLKKVFNSEL